jgi:hypothetical protein
MMANTIGGILASGKLGNFSNIRISPSIRPQLLGAIKDGKQSSQNDITAKRKDVTEKLKQLIHDTKHKSFVKCVEWTRTCDAAELSNRGVM